MSDQETPQVPGDDAPAPIPREVTKRALKAFKRRIKLMRLDDESGIAGGPISGGRQSGIVAITPPDQYPREVWDALVEQGRLKRTTHGQYEIIPL
ncbi:MAG: hypothetical protein IID46_09600 [Planctomycetes bacterium]|nr:hypothetical protein [Planctomycetota bacterium]